MSESTPKIDQLFVIPARGGSKGVPRKNLRAVGGIPLVARAVRTAIRAGRELGGNYRVVCSTDDTEIAEVAREWGADVPFMRPEALATDEATTVDVVLHAMEIVGQNPAAIVVLQATSPLTSTEDVINAVQLFERHGDPVVTVAANEHPLEWSFRLSDTNRLVSIFDSEPERRQDALSSYRVNGAVFVSSPRLLREHRSFTRPTARGSVMVAGRSIDIDSSDDLQLATALTPRSNGFVLDGRRIADGEPVFIIAEAGVNHDGDLAKAHALIDAAAEAGADAVKFQTWVTELICAPDSLAADYQRRSGYESQFAMLKGLELPYAWHAELRDHAASRGLMFLSTPDELQSARFLVELGIPAIKIGSAELRDRAHLRNLATLGRPIILSTGMATLDDVALGLEAIQGVSDAPVVLLHCVSAYPTPDEEMNLRCIHTLRDTFGVSVGLSDHSEGHEVAVMATALGISVLEKHFTLDRGTPGPDHAMSMEPAEFRRLVDEVRRTERILGTGRKSLSAVEKDAARATARFLRYAESFEQGHRLRTGDFVALRGTEGLDVGEASRLVGKSLRRSVAALEVASAVDVEI